MTRILMLPLLALALFASAFTPPSAPSDEEAVAVALDQFIAAFNAHDAEALTALYADGAQIDWGDGMSATVTDREAFTAMGRQWHAQNAALRMDVASTSIRLLDSNTATAFLSGTAHMGETPLGVMNALYVFQKTADGWRIAAEQIAQVPPARG